MSRYKVTASYELDIVDEEAAIAYVSEMLARTGQIAPGASTAEESARNHPEVVANVVAVNLLLSGAETLPFLRVENSQTNARRA